jgi:glucose-1-phosphate adenylyltransferase
MSLAADTSVFTGARVHSSAHLEEAVVLPGVEIAPSTRLSNVIVDRGVRIPQGLVVGKDPDLEAMHFRRTESGIGLITQPMIDWLD